MIGFNVRTQIDSRQVLAKVRRANIANLGHAGAAIRLTARRSIRKRQQPSTPGQPPHTREGLLRQAILFSVERPQQRVVIGPSAALVGTSGKAHEFGGRYRRENYPRRPFMAPALAKLRPRLPRFWADSIR
ncbi:MAG: hypothetical protein KatS3mg082_2725 [Nitrospiraceae bacterium]|nr:MAG: hypothetical protein KatS3mg082_2725 [Nitrospiraceae bacterium]GIW81328.1 MAG: hypothetical protein KatS3mg105_3135 [Gemmatales bacterium]